MFDILFKPHARSGYCELYCNIYCKIFSAIVGAVGRVQGCPSLRYTKLDVCVEPANLVTGTATMIAIRGRFHMRHQRATVQ